MDIYKRLQSRERVLATALAQDLGLVFKKGVETLPIIKPEEDTSVTTTATKQAIHELKERKKLAKRIIKAIQPQLEVAVHAEADLTQQSGDKMIQDLERLFETCVAATPESVIEGSQYTINEQEPTGMDVDPKDDEEAEVDESKGTCSLDTYTGIKINPREAAALEQAVQEEMNDADEVVPISTTSNDVSQDEEQEVDDTSTELKPNLPLNGIKSQTPPETNGYAEPPQHQQPQPPTPPISNVGAASTISQDPNTDTTSFLTEGGRPWYLKDYDPVSSTFAEPEIAAPETVRSVTDELSEIDDDELNDLGVDTEMGEALDVREVDGKPAAAVERTKKGKVKRRWKGYK
jgi:NuA3 HAT complex component NTO1